MSSAGRYVKALWDFPGENSTDLSFTKNEVITVVDKSSDGWWSGFVKDRATPTGTFPSSFVEPLHKTEDTPVVEAAAAGDGDDTLFVLPTSTRKRVYSLHSVERVTKIEVVSAERQLVDGKLNSFYSVSATTTKRGTTTVSKRYHQVCELEAQLRKLFPEEITEVSSELRSAEVMSSKKTARVMELRRTTAERYLQSLLGLSSSAMLLLTWLFPGQQIGLQEEESASVPPSPAAAGEAEPPAELRPPVPGPDPSTAEARPFTLPTLDAFDEMTETGLTVSLASGAPLPGSGCSAPGQTVSLAFQAYIWDGAERTMTGALNVPEFDVVLGTFTEPHIVPPGLHVAMTRVPVDAPFVAVLTSDLAFGNSGYPPALPAFAQIVVEGCVSAVYGTPSSGDLLASAKAFVAETSSAPVPRMPAAAIAAGSDSTEALTARFESLTSAPASSRVSLAAQPGRNRVVVGASNSSPPPGAGLTHVAGFRRSASQPISLDEAEAALRKVMAAEAAAGRAPGTPSPPGPPRRKTVHQVPPPPAASPVPVTLSGTGASPLAAMASPVVSPATSAANSPRGGVVPPPVPRRVRSNTARSLLSGRKSPLSSPPSPMDAPSPVASPSVSRRGSTTTPTIVRAGDSVGGFQVLAYDTLAAMKERKEYPDDVDSRCLEAYLSVEEFGAVFGMAYDAFTAYPKWKQANKRKEAKLF